MKGFRAAQVVVALLFVAFLSSLVYVFFFLPKKPASTGNPVVARMVPLTPAGAIVRDGHPSWDNVTCNSIGEKRLRIGMRKEMVEAVWGRPTAIIWRVDGREEVASTEYTSTKEEEWIMDPESIPHPRRVIFRSFMKHSEPDNNAKVVFIQESVTFRKPR